jgi:hypothetical protein
VNLVAMTENEGGHLRVPEARLVTEVDTGFQHLTHGNCHEILREGWVLSRLPHPAPFLPFGSSG